MSTIKTETTAVKDVLSHARLSTYEKATTKSSAIELYVWNAHVSGAMLLPLHICEVRIRNGISDMLTKVYGPKWAWSTGFEKSLPASHANYYFLKKNFNWGLMWNKQTDIQVNGELSTQLTDIAELAAWLGEVANLKVMLDPRANQLFVMEN